jgi:hypothetical protein
MPDHGTANAMSECCRPSSAYFAGTQPHRNPFWRDGATWRVAARNTRNCLIGCMIGDAGMIIYVQAYHPHLSMWLIMALAMAAGLITSIIFEALILKWREGFPWKSAFRTAFSMSFLSMVGMEAAANATDFMLTGGRVPLNDPVYWSSLGLSLAAGFIVPLPYNYWQFKKYGKVCH